MRLDRLDAMTKGWFVGDFSPTLYATQQVEVAVKNYAVGEAEARHFHKIATEITLVVSGEIEMCGQTLGAGDIITLEPNESSAFRALSDAVTVVVKLPGATDDKYLD